MITCTTLSCLRGTAGILPLCLLGLIALFTVCNWLTLQNIKTYIAFESNENVYELRRMKKMRRDALVTSSNDRNALLLASKTYNHKEFYSKVKMEAYCQHRKRIGEQADGGKVVCNPKRAKKDCTLLSLGLDKQLAYDKHIFDVTGKQCRIYGADKDPHNPEIVDTYTEMNGGQLFVGRIPDELTILKMMESSGRKEVEMLKIDIDGGEHTGLEPLLENYFVCQIFIEIHGSPAEHLKMLQTMAKYGFRLFSIDPKTICVHCCEYSLINEMCMAQYEVVPLGITIPNKDF